MSNMHSAVVKPVVNPFSIPNTELVFPNLHEHITADWPDIKTIVEEDSGGDYRLLYLYDNLLPKLEITLDTTYYKLKTSDGAVYDQLGMLTHNWDPNKDISGKYRWAILYRNASGAPQQSSFAIGFTCNDGTSRTLVSFRDWFNDWSSLITIIPFDISAGTDFEGMFQYCSLLQTLPLMDFSSATNLRTFCYTCKSLRIFPPLDLSSTTSLRYAFRYCTALKALPGLTFISTANLGYAFADCSSLSYLELSDPAAWIIEGEADFSASPLYGEVMREIFNRLLTVVSQTIKISSKTNGQLTDEDRLVATNKGWTISVSG
jgi:hypothetical protein